MSTARLIVAALFLAALAAPSAARASGATATGNDEFVFAFPIARFEDRTLPVVTNLRHTFLAASNQVRFNWCVDDAATFRCRIDTGPFGACSDGQTFTLPEGTRTPTVRATDAAGNVAADGTLTIRFGAATLTQDGEYTFFARSRDGADVDQTPLRHTWSRAADHAQLT